MSTSEALDIHLRSLFKIPYPNLKKSDQTEPGRDSSNPYPYKFFDVKFYPYRPKDSPIFALVGVRHVLICRPPARSEDSVSVLLTLRDLEDIPDVSWDILNSCEWNHVTAAQPLLSVAGNSGLIKVFDALTGDLFDTLVGHGIGIVNDLATHPVYPHILASGSMDSSIRVWNLRRCNDKTNSPCIIICGHGQAHKEGILTVSWHPRGRYLLSGAHDHMICLWTIPDLSDTSPFWPELAAPRRSAEKVRVIHYPHFISLAVHSNYVDCVQFYGDLILSKAAEENKIVLWKIEGFNSRMTPPTPDSAPKTKEHLDTRNGFLTHLRQQQLNGLSTPDGASTSTADTSLTVTNPPPLYTRLLEFSIPNSTLFYMRFSLLLPTPTYPTHTPLLTFANLQSRVYFWDLQALETGHINPLPRSPLHSQPERPKPDRTKYPLSDPHKPQPAQLELVIPDFHGKHKWFQGRGCAWSPDGRWCVVVGESGRSNYEEGVCAIFERNGRRQSNASDGQKPEGPESSPEIIRPGSRRPGIGMVS